MIGYGLSLDPLRSAPPEMRRWIEREVAASLAALAGPPHELPQPHAASLATCLPEEALHVFELIKGEFPLSQAFFELARETPANPAVAPWHAIDLADLLRHTRIPDGDRLADCLGAINRAFPAIRNDPGASLFGFDPQGHIFIQETTRRSIRQVWEQLFAARVPAAGLPERTGRSSAASRRRAWVPAKASRGIPRPRPICPVSGRGNGVMPCLALSDMPEAVLRLPLDAREIFPAAFNNAWQSHAAHSRRDREESAFRIAWAAVRKRCRREGGVRVLKNVPRSSD